MRILRQGCEGNDVRFLQYRIGAKADGVFGPATKNRLLEVQREKGLSVDGVCGPATRAALDMDDFNIIICMPGNVEFLGAPYEAETKPLKTLKEWAKEAPKARYIMNLAFFNSKEEGRDKYGVIKGRTLTYVKGRGYDIGYGGTDEFIRPNNDNICSGYKLGVKDGKRKAVSAIGKRARNANGLLKDGRYFHIQSITPCTESALVSWAMKNFLVETLFIQDGGGSVGFYDADKDVLLAPEREGINGRPVATVAAVYE